MGREGDPGREALPPVALAGAPGSVPSLTASSLGVPSGHTAIEEVVAADTLTAGEAVTGRRPSTGRLNPAQSVQEITQVATFDLSLTWDEVTRATQSAPPLMTWGEWQKWRKRFTFPQTSLEG